MRSNSARKRRLAKRLALWRHSSPRGFCGHMMNDNASHIALEVLRAMLDRQVPRRPMRSTLTLVREFPPVDPTMLENSAHTFRPLLQDATHVVSRLAERSFALPLMAAAQAGRQQEVDRLMKTAAGSSRVKTQYTPSGLVITIEPASDTCCHLSMTLRWGQ